MNYLEEWLEILEIREIELKEAIDKATREQYRNVWFFKKTLNDNIQLQITAQEKLEYHKQENTPWIRN